MNKDDPIADEAISSEEKWSMYVDHFIQLSSTEGLLPHHHHQLYNPTQRRQRQSNLYNSASVGGAPNSATNSSSGGGGGSNVSSQQQFYHPHQPILMVGSDPFLRRNLPTSIPSEPPTNVLTRSGLELKICLNTYKIFFVEHTEDFFMRFRAKERISFQKPNDVQDLGDGDDGIVKVEDGVSDNGVEMRGNNVDLGINNINIPDHDNVHEVGKQYLTQSFINTIIMQRLSRDMLIRKKKWDRWHLARRKELTMLDSMDPIVADEKNEPSITVSATIDGTTNSLSLSPPSNIDNNIE